MKNLIDFFVRYKHWFVFALLEVFSLVMLFSYNGYQKSVYFTTANGVVGYVYNAISSVSSYLNLREVNAQLEEDNEALRKRLLGMEKKLADMGVDSLVIDSLSASYSLVRAQVVNNSIHRGANLMTINKGEADGITSEMAVVNSSGVVGIVYMTSSHYSIVMPLINIHTQISCRVRGTDFFGSLTWKRGDSQVAYASGFPRHAKFKVGQIIETNGYSDIFPEGIPIGKVIKVMNSEDGMSYMLMVQLSAKFSNIRDVNVITDFAAPERKKLEEVADSLKNDDDAKIDKDLLKKADEAKKNAEKLEIEQKKQEEEARKAAEEALADGEGAALNGTNGDNSKELQTKEE